MRAGRRRRRSEKKPVNKVSLVTMAVGILGCILFLWAIFRSVYGGNTGRAETAIGVLSILVSFIMLVRGLIENRKDSFNRSSRLLGFLFPLISFGLWISVYILGAIRG